MPSRLINRAASAVNVPVPGTYDKHIDPFRETIMNENLVYLNISCQEAFETFSVEEHRFQDYQQGRAGLLADSSAPFVTSPFSGFSSSARKKLDLYV